MFDEFLDELRRRQAEAAGGQPPRARRVAPEDEAAEPDLDDPAPAEGRDDSDPALDADADEPTRDDDAGEPTPLKSRGGAASGGRAARGAGGPPRRPNRGAAVGGPNDGARRTLRRQFAIAVGLLATVFVIVMLAVGVELWTDAIWYTSVGFEDVFWTRLGVQILLFLLGLVVTVIVLLGNLWLAGRLTPAPAEGKSGSVRAWLDRFSEAVAESEQRSNRPADPFGRRPAPGPRGAIDVTPYDLPDATPFGRLVIAVVAIFVALTVGGALASNWETVLLWMNRVPFDTAGAVTDPVFGRDISFFLFELPFLRFIQASLIGLIVASLLVAGVRYLVAALDGGAVFDTRVRVHLGVLAGLFLIAIAFGYQLDKFELVYSNRGVATGVELHRCERPVLRLRRPDRAVGDRRSVPRRRGVLSRHVAARGDPRGLVDRVDRDRAGLPGPRPAPHRRRRTSSSRSSRTSRTTSR